MLQACNHGVANATPGQQGVSFLPLLEFFTLFYFCFIFVAKERSNEILIELTLVFVTF